MNVLHLFSDWKWTGPAEPTVSLCEALRDQGVNVVLAYRRTPIDFPERTVEKAVKNRGVPGYDGFRLNRYFSVRDWLFDRRAIRQYVKDHQIDIVHTNLSHDHFTAVFALSFAGRRPLIVRSDHKRDGLPADPFIGWAMRRTDGLVTFSRKIMEGDVARFHFPRERTCVLPPGIKSYSGPLRDMRQDLGIGVDEKVIGVIGRLKPDRGYDVILKAFSILRGRMDKVKLVIMGRSSQIEKSIMEPLAGLGLEKEVILAGYRIEDYFSVINTFDVYVMMRAGSDGTARALREVLSMGVPAVVSDRGMLEELVEDGRSGFVIHDENDLAAGLERILSDTALRKSFSERAKTRAREEWDYPSQAGKLADFYEVLLTRKK